MGWNIPQSERETPPKVVESDQAKILCDFQIQTDMLVMANQLHIMLTDKQQKRAVVINVAILSDSHIIKKEHEKVENYQGPKEELEKMWKVKATMVSVLSSRFQAQQPRSLSRRVQKWTTFNARE